MKHQHLFNYVGQERAARKLLLENGMSAEEVALMPSEVVSDRIQDQYEVVSRYGEDIVLVKNEDMEAFKKICKVLSR